ncbi:hypothetical protein BpHYR1_008413 [Brachionus plicatilis]|uniref:Uncharacterized protein n=1 Tax=Brachionus plicatilis TaxID=10195 RepID=A0A3M7SBZ9_BRAPC|nr:hypothetical protein BpHYR1_008413 [Brachionus plicatilis]
MEAAIIYCFQINCEAAIFPTPALSSLCQNRFLKEPLSWLSDRHSEDQLRTQKLAEYDQELLILTILNNFNNFAEAVSIVITLLIEFNFIFGLCLKHKIIKDSAFRFLRKMTLEKINKSGFLKFFLSFATIILPFNSTVLALKELSYNKLRQGKEQSKIVNHLIDYLFFYLVQLTPIILSIDILSRLTLKSISLINFKALAIKSLFETSFEWIKVASNFIETRGLNSKSNQNYLPKCFEMSVNQISKKKISTFLKYLEQKLYCLNVYPDSLIH